MEKWLRLDHGLPIGSGKEKLLKTMLQQEVHADIRIEGKGGSAKAHRCVLACISPVFEAMFRNQMQEQQTSVLEMPDMSKEALLLFLKAIYCGFDDNDEESLDREWKEVFTALHKYDVPFQEAGAAFMRSKVSMDNCWEYLDKASHWDHEAIPGGMVSVCLDYMYLNCLQITMANNYESAILDYPRPVLMFTKNTIERLKEDENMKRLTKEEEEEEDEDDDEDEVYATL